MFPFTSKFSSIIENKSADKAQMLICIKQAVDEKRAKIVFIGDEELIYSGTTDKFPWRGNFAQSVDKGTFRLFHENGSSILEYEIYMSEGSYFIIGVSIIIGLASLNIWFALFYLLVLGGAVSVSAYFKHKAFFYFIVNRLKTGVKNTHQIKSSRVLTREDKKEMGLGILIALLVMILIILLIMFLPLENAMSTGRSCFISKTLNV